VGAIAIGVIYLYLSGRYNLKWQNWEFVCN